MPLALGAGAIIAYSLFRKTQAAGTLDFYPERVQNFHFDSLTPVFTLGITVHNTSNQNFTINSIAGYALANNFDIGSISNFTPQTIVKSSQTVLLIDVRLRLIGIVNDLIRAIQDGHFQQTVILKAYANVDNLQVPLNLTYKIPGELWS